MRALSRAVLAKHPVIAFILVAIRWVWWAAVGHPIGAGLLLLGLLSQIPISWLLPMAVFAVAIDGLCILMASGQSHVVGRQYWLWAQACRFRRRWPSTCVDVGIHDAQEFPMVLSTNFYSNPEGLRPILSAPRLSIVPRFSSLDSASFSIRPWGVQRFDELKSQVVRIADIDDRIVEARLEGPPEVRSQWRLIIVFVNRRYGQAPNLDRGEPAPSGHPTNQWPLPTRSRRRRRGSDRNIRPPFRSDIAERHQRRRNSTKHVSPLAVWSIDYE